MPSARELSGKCFSLPALYFWSIWQPWTCRTLVKEERLPHSISWMSNWNFTTFYWSNTYSSYYRPWLLHAVQNFVDEIGLFHISPFATVVILRYFPDRSWFVLMWAAVFSGMIQRCSMCWENPEDFHSWRIFGAMVDLYWRVLITFSSIFIHFHPFSSIFIHFLCLRICGLVWEWLKSGKGFMMHHGSLRMFPDHPSAS